MSGGQIVALVVALYLVVAAGVLGALLERERLLNPDGERGWRWLGSLALVVVFWPVVGLLWPDSRPASPPQPRPRPAAYTGKLPLYDFRDLTPRTTWEWRGKVNENVGQQVGATAVDRPASLALCGRVEVGQRVFVNSLGLLLERREMNWQAVLCGCRYNFSGFPVVVCRQHRSDTDPHGEPDEGEEEVGR